MAECRNIWNESMTLTLLDVYESNEFLWNAFHPNYTNKQKREEAYSSIIGALDSGTITLKDVKIKLKNLRSSYSGELKKIRDSRLSGEKEYAPKVFWFAKMDGFLRDVVVPQNSVLQREVEWHGRIVSSVVRLCRLGPAEAVARGLERRWHHLYLRALEWQCHLESCLSRIDAESLLKPYAFTDSDEEPVLKHPRLVGPPDDEIQKPITCVQRLLNYAGNTSSDDSFSEDDNDENCHDLVDSFNQISTGSEADTEGSILDDDITMGSLPMCEVLITQQQQQLLNLEMPLLEDATPQPNGCDQIVSEVEVLDCVDGIDAENLDTSLYDEPPTPVTVVKRPKKVNESKFTSSNRKSKNLAVYYFKHPDTESDTQLISGASGTDEKSQEETSEDEWTYTVCEKDNISGENNDIMTSSLDQIDEIKDMEVTVNSSKRLDFDYDTEVRYDQAKFNEIKTAAPESIQRLVNQADEMVQKKAQEMSNNPLGSSKSLQKKSKLVRNFKPLNLNDTSKTGFQNQNKMSRIKEWLQQNTPDDQSSESSQQVLDSCDASGEYTTGDSDRNSVTSEELSPSVATYCNVTSSQEHSINVATPTNHGTPKVILRGKRNNTTQNTRPWSVSCLSQLSYAAKESSASALNTPTADNIRQTSGAYGRTSGMSISESALNTLASTPNHIRSNSKDKFQGSSSSVKTTIQANLSSSTTINEGCVNCYENTADKKCSLRRKRLKLRKRHPEGTVSSELETEELRLAQLVSSVRSSRLVKSCSFSGKDSITQKDFKHDRCSSDPSSSRKNRFDTTSTSGNDSEEENKGPRLPQDLAVSTDQTIHASASEDQTLDGSTDHISEATPNFKIGREGGMVRPRPPLLNIDRERASLLGLEIVERSVLVETADRDSDVDRSIQTAGTEEHSSFSEQAWDFYQEKYQSEAYSEAPDSDAARRLLEFGDDYRNFLDSQSDCCSSLSAHPDPSPLMSRRRVPMQNISPTNTESRKSMINKGSYESPEYGSFGRRSKKSSTSSFDRKKSLMDSLERSKRSPGTESDRIKRAKKILSDSLERKNTKRLSISDCDNLNETRRKYTSSNSTNSDVYNSSLEYQYVKQITNGNKPDILDSLTRRTRKPSCDSNKSRLSDDSNSRLPDSSLNSSMESPARRKRSSDGVDAAYDVKHKNHSSRRRGSHGVALLHLSGSNSEGRGTIDSDSDVDDVKNLLHRSRSQLEDAEAVLAKEEVTPDLLQINDYVRNPDSELEAKADDVVEAAVEGDEEGVDKEKKGGSLAARLCFAVAIFSVIVFVCLNSYK